MQKRGGGFVQEGGFKKGGFTREGNFFFYLFFFREGNISERKGTCQRGKITREGD